MNIRPRIEKLERSHGRSKPLADVLIIMGEPTAEQQARIAEADKQGVGLDIIRFVGVEPEGRG